MNRSMSAILGKLVNQPGRIAFLKAVKYLEANEQPPRDSFSFEYYYFIQQMARTQLTSQLQKYRGKGFRGLLRLPLYLVFLIWAYIQLKITNAIVQSFIQEQKLLEGTYEKNSKNSHH